jgi:Family of unknown function (DUF5522)
VAYTFRVSDAMQRPLVEGEDFYYEDGLMVLTAAYLRRRGFCCDCGCRNCPYREKPSEAE